jgi:hypothetical protein
MSLTAVTDAEFLDWTRHPLGTLVERTPTDRERLSLACDWYWRSTEADDGVTEYLELWFVVEVIAMPNTTDIRPVRLRLATHTAVTRASGVTSSDGTSAGAASWFTAKARERSRNPIL